jgi:predicted deacylase
MKKGRRRKRVLAAGAVFLALGLLAAAQIRIPSGPPAAHDIRPGPAVKVKALSDYLPSLAKTAGDTPVFILEGAEPGGTAFVAGGTHGGEIARSMAAILLVERRGRRGRLIVVPMPTIPRSRPGPETGVGPRHSQSKRKRDRTFRIRSRLTNPRTGPILRPKKPAETDNSRPGSRPSISGPCRRQPGQRIAFAVVARSRQGADLAFDLTRRRPEAGWR